MALTPSSTVLVSGGAGFIGSHLVDRLVRDGHHVKIIDNFATGNRHNLKHVADEVDLVEGDVRSYERAHAAVKGCDVVFHQAALPSVPRSIQDPLTSHAVNTTGTLNLLLAARDEGVSRFIAASSSSVYGANAELPKCEDLQPLPISPYAVSKLSAEGFCRSFFEVYGLETVALRYFNVFGPRQDPNSQYSAVIPRFIIALAGGRQPEVFGDGSQTRDFTFVEDTVNGNLLAASAEGVAGQAFNIACGRATSLNQLLEELNAILGVNVPAKYLEPRPGDVQHSMADISAAHSSLGFQPSVSLSQGLHATVNSLASG